jgi:peptidoglycan biosynthesis protein MviN/MurJ (putative lipid II flippase)
MLKESLLSKKSFIDFTYMFLSNVIKKVFGFFREMILAFFFGSSLVYANYLLLKTVAEFFSQLTLGNALQANLLPKFTKLYLENESIDLSNVYSFSKLFMWKLFFFKSISTATINMGN